MKILIIANEFNSFKIYKDTTYAIIRELSKRKHHLFHTLVNNIFIKNNNIYVINKNFSFIDNNEKWFLYEQEKILKLNDFDLILMRTDPPFDLEYLYSTHIFSLAKKQGIKIYNSGFGMREFNEKLSILNFPEFITPTLITSSIDIIKNFLNEHKDIIVKPLDGMGGTGIFRITLNDYNINSILETATNLNTKTIMVQKYIPEIKAGDKRVLVIDGKPVNYVLARIPKEGETRGNLAAGGTGVAMPINENDRNIAIKVGSILKEQGIILAGLDIIGNYLTEINVTSPTGFQEIMKQTDFDVAKHFADVLEEKYYTKKLN